MRETPEAFEVLLELPGVDNTAIAVKATEQTLLISGERLSLRQPGCQRTPLEAVSDGSETPVGAEKGRGPLLSE